MNQVIEYMKVGDITETGKNVRGETGDKEKLADLVRSVKDKGILTPLIVRATNVHKDGEKPKFYELVAGHRRLAAAVAAKLPTVPVMVMKLNDQEAKEVQITENLQREDVHPLEEGAAYRDLIESHGYAIKDVAAKVGKGEAYVKQRLLLTNLTGKSAFEYRSGRISDGMAAVIARLSDNNQALAINTFKERKWWKIKDLEDWVRKEFAQPLSFQPWLSDKAETAAMPPHVKGCGTSGGDLFGAIKEGQCTDLKCWEARMKAHIAFRKKQNPELLSVSKDYGQPSHAGVLPRNAYRGLSTKPKEQCESAKKAIIVEGEGLGTLIDVCADPKCPKHGDEMSSEGAYERTPKEVAKRRSERKREEKRRAAQAALMGRTVVKVGWPLSEKALNMLLEVALSRGFNVVSPVARRRGIEPAVKKGYYDSAKKHAWTERDFTKPLRDKAKAMSKPERAQLLIELILTDHMSSLDKYSKML